MIYCCIEYLLWLEKNIPNFCLGFVRSLESMFFTMLFYNLVVALQYSVWASHEVYSEVLLGSGFFCEDPMVSG